MATIRGTPNKDIYTVKQGDTFEGEEGDDEITISKWGNAQGGPGNDIIKAEPGLANREANVYYWSSSNPITVDLEAGYAIDGFGGRDTLVNIHSIHGIKQNGDKVYGTSTEDYFFSGPWNTNNPGTFLIDGRGGIDQVTIWANQGDNRGDLIFSVSADARVTLAYHAKTPNFIYEFRNIEILSVWNRDNDVTTTYDLRQLTDLSHAGEEILLRGAKGWQSGNKGSPVTLTYSFPAASPATGGEAGAGFTAFNASQQQVVRDLFYVLQQQTGLAFAEVAGDAGQMRFSINQQSNTRGYSYLPDAYKGDARAGDVWIDLETAAQMQPGQEGYYVLLHEIGHALGLQHPLTESDTSGATVLLSSLATASNTLMLDLSAGDVSGTWPSWFGSFDIQALRALYGSRSFAAGNDVYSLTDATGTRTIVDDGGVDALDASGSSVSAAIDLRPGKSSSVGADSDGTSRTNNVVIPSGVFIENVTGTFYDDVIVGNVQNNVITFIGGNDIVDGQAGMDTLRLWNKAAEFKVGKDTSSGNWNVEALNNATGSIEMQNVERIYFSDKAWALDMGNNENAGRTAKILGALFGLEGLSYPSFRGIGLYFLDAGYSYEALMGAAVDTRLWVGASKADVAKVLMGNIPGLVLDVNTYSSTTAMAIAAADSDLNKAMINLVGLASTGFDYIILG